ncbi:MAG: dienelactone hydrolase family protein [Betaproteobacteria bacterium]
MLRQTAVAVLGLLVGAAAHAAIKEEPVTYQAGDTTLKGLIVYDDAKKGPRPGVIVVHEWWGITKHTRAEARRFARRGYTAFVADMYGEAKSADNPKDASGLMKSLLGDPAAVQARFNAAREQLGKHATVNAKKIGASGYCMGGTVVLNMARAGNVDAVAAFHPSLGGYKPAAEPVKAKVLVLNGADDPFNKPEAIDAFKKDMDAAKADYKFINYPGAVHAFTNPDATATGKQYNLPLAYNEKVDKQSKAEANKFFAAAFK